MSENRFQKIVLSIILVVGAFIATYFVTKIHRAIGGFRFNRTDLTEYEKKLLKKYTLKARLVALFTFILIVILSLFVFKK